MFSKKKLWPVFHGKKKIPETWIDLAISIVWEVNALPNAHTPCSSFMERDGKGNSRCRVQDFNLAVNMATAGHT